MKLMPPSELKYVLALVFCWLTSSSAVADTYDVKGIIHFTKKPPFAALLYAESVLPGESATIDQIDKKFIKKLVVSAPGKPITLKNSDQVSHNIYANDFVNNIKFDVGLMSPGRQSVLNDFLGEGTLLRVGCKIHPRMRAYIATVRSRHYQIFEFSKKKYKYSVMISNVPEHINEFRLMMPHYDTVTATLNSGEHKRFDLIKKDKVRGSISLSRIEK